jgi:hypothetical protein
MFHLKYLQQRFANIKYPLTSKDSLSTIKKIVYQQYIKRLFVFIIL